MWRLRRVVKRDLETGTTESFDYGPGVIAEEHVLVPRPAPSREDDGWLVGAFLDYVQGLSGIAVFDARGVPRRRKECTSRHEKRCVNRPYMGRRLPAMTGPAPARAGAAAR